jgi:predicted permease
MKLLRRLKYFWQRDRMAADLAEEMEFHRAMLSHDAGEPAARRAWGNATLDRESARGVWIAPWLEGIWRDFGYGIRGLRRQPGFTLVALIALGSAIGLNTALFTVFNALAYRPWPVKDPARVVNLHRAVRTGPGAGEIIGTGVAEWRYLAEHTKAFTGLILSAKGERVQGETGQLRLTYVSANYFSTLGVDMARGRGFLPDEDRPFAPQAVAVLSYQAWMNRFGGAHDIVGRMVRLDEIPFTIVGVAPESFPGTEEQRPDLWAPLSARRALRPNDASVLPFLTSIHYCCSPLAGRLAPGVPREQGAAEIGMLMGQLHAAEKPKADYAFIAAGTAILDSVGRDKSKIVPAFAAMFIAVMLVLLLACANVGNLLLARAAARSSEIAVRLSLGGSRARLVRQLLVESLALAFAAAAFGLLLAWIGPLVIVARMIPDVAIRIAPDWRVAAFTAGLAFLACLAFGLAPALAATRGSIVDTLKRESATGTARLRLRHLLLATQVAISVILLASAGLLIRGIQRAQHQDPGFHVDSVTVASIELPAASYTGARSAAFTTDLIDGLAHAESLPPTALASDAPMQNSRSFTNIRRAGEPESRDSIIQMHEVTGSYFDVLGIPIVMGRNFARDDRGKNVVLLNEAAAQQLWGRENPVGGKILSNSKEWEVAGVVKNVYTTDLNEVGPMMYWPSPGGFGPPQLLIGASSAGANERIEAIVRRLEPKGRVVFQPLSENLRANLEPAKYAAILAGALGALALALASIGMCGVFAYMVRQRTREIGVRMALGARPREIVRMVLASNLRAVAWGCAAGLGGALAMTRLIRSMMNGVSALDPITYAGVFLLLIAAAGLASAVPARRAAQVNPLRALRWE